MAVRSRSHLSDATLLRTLADHLATENGACAEVLADLAEVDARRLYVPAGFESMFAWCVHHLRFPKEMAYKRIRVARAARRFPVILDRISEGRLNLSAVVMLAAHLTGSNAGELIAAASGRTIDELELLLAERFPRPDLPTRIAAVPVAPIDRQCGNPLSTWTIEHPVSEPPTRTVEVHLPIPSEPPAAPMAPELSTWTVAPPAPRARLAPLAPGRFAIQVTVGGGTHEKLRRAQELLRRQVPDGNVAAVLDRALDALIEKLEKRKFAATDRPRRAHTTRPDAQPANPRHVPAAVKRAVWKRDGGRCTFVAANGRRCDTRGGLEFDHEIPVARGGRATTGNLRLRCRPHNQFEAECVFGAGHVEHKREAAREAMEQRRREKKEHAGAVAADRPRATADRAQRDAASGARAGGPRAQPRTRATHTPSPSGTITASS